MVHVVKLGPVFQARWGGECNECFVWFSEGMMFDSMSVMKLYARAVEKKLRILNRGES